MKTLLSVDVSQCSTLTYLQLNGTQLNTIDVTHNPELQFLDLANNNLSAIDLSSQNKLETLMLGNNRLSECTVPTNHNLSYLTLHGNQLSNEEFTKIFERICNRTNNTEGRFVVIDTENQNEKNIIYKSTVDKFKTKNWKILDWLGGFGYEKEILYEGEEDVSEVPEGTPCVTFVLNDHIIDFTCFSTEPVWIELKKGEFLEYPAGDVNVKGNSAEKVVKLYTKGLQSIKSGSQPIQSIDLSQAKELQELMVFRSPLEQIDLSACPKLTRVSLQNNQLSEVDLSSLSLLEHLDIHGNRNLSQLNTSANQELKFLSCGQTAIPQINVSHNPQLEILECSSLGLSSLDITNLPMLCYLGIWDNNLNEKECNKIVNDLPDWSENLPGDLYFVDSSNGTEKNKPSEYAVSVAKKKGWNVFDFYGDAPREFEGFYSSAQELLDQGGLQYSLHDGKIVVKGLTAREEVRLLSLRGETMVRAQADLAGICSIEIPFGIEGGIISTAHKSYKIVIP